MLLALQVFLKYKNKKKRLEGGQIACRKKNSLFLLVSLSGFQRIQVEGGFASAARQHLLGV